jgi:hypothetical protein
MTQRVGGLTLCSPPPLHLPRIEDLMNGERILTAKLRGTSSPHSSSLVSEVKNFNFEQFIDFS